MAMKPIALTQAPPAQATPAQATEAATAFVITAPEPKPSATNHTGAPAGQVQRQTEVKMTMDKTVKSAEEFVSFGQGNFEAMMKASQIWAAGVQDMQKAVSATAQAQLETAMGTFKALSGVKSLKEIGRAHV